MPVTATPSAARMLTRQRIRMAMRDVGREIPNSGGLNVLLDNVEFSDEEIDNAIAFAVDWYNAVTPMIGEATADQINRYLLYSGAASFLMQSESFRQIRNQATVQDAEVAPIGADDKHVMYAQLEQRLYERFEEKARRVKIQLNMEACYGGFGSGYRGTTRRYNW